MNINEAQLPLEKRNLIQGKLWQQLVRDGIVRNDDTDAFYVLGKYYADYEKKTGKVLSYSRLAAYAQGYLSESLKEVAITDIQFKSWFNKSRIKDKYGKPRIVYHGTFTDFSTFDLNKTNPDSIFGQGFYFTSSKPDVNHNYSQLSGPDPTSKLDYAIEMYDGELTEDERQKIIADYITKNNILPGSTDSYNVRMKAIQDYIQSNPEVKQEYMPNLSSLGMVKPCYLRMENPCYIGFGNKDTYFDYDAPYDEENDEYSEATGTAVDVISFLSNYDDELSGIWDKVYDGGITSFEIYTYLNTLDLMDEEISSGSIFSEMILYMGYDGIVQNPSVFFGKKANRGMKNVERAIHYIVFNPSQIQSCYGKMKHVNENLQEYLLKAIKTHYSRVNIMMDPEPEEILIAWMASGECGVKFIADSVEHKFILFPGDSIAHSTATKELNIPYSVNSRYYYGSSESRPESGKLVDIANYCFGDYVTGIGTSDDVLKVYTELYNQDWSWMQNYVNMNDFESDKKNSMRIIKTIIQSKKKVNENVNFDESKLSLLEAVNYDKYKEILDPDLFKFLCDLDPTLDKKYSQWIIRCFMKEYITPFEGLGIQKFYPLPFYSLFTIIARVLKEGGLLNWAVDYRQLFRELQQFMNEDCFKIIKDLKNYTILKNKKLLDMNITDRGIYLGIKNPSPEYLYNIMNLPTFKTLSDLLYHYSDVLDKVEQEAPINPNEAEKWYEDDKWLVVVPLTEGASKKYGKNTRWYTAGDDDNRFKFYTQKEYPESKLIDIINKFSIEKTQAESPFGKMNTVVSHHNRKWQLHLESHQWMDEQDEDIGNRAKFVATLPKEVCSAIYAHTNAFAFNPDKEGVILRLLSNEDSSNSLKQTLSGLDNELSNIMKDTETEPLDYIEHDTFEFARQRVLVDIYSGTHNSAYIYGYNNPSEFIDGPSDIEEPKQRDENGWTDEEKVKAGKVAVKNEIDRYMDEGPEILNKHWKQYVNEGVNFSDVYDSVIAHLNKSKGSIITIINLLCIFDFSTPTGIIVQNEQDGDGLQESLREAVNFNFYQDKIDIDTFNWLKALDPTPDAKYARWIIEHWLKEFILPITIWLQKKAHDYFGPNIPNEDYVGGKSFVKEDLNIFPITRKESEGRLVLPFHDNTFKENLRRFYFEDCDRITEDLKWYNTLKNKKVLQPQDTNILNIKGFKELGNLLHEKYQNEIEHLKSNEPLSAEEFDIWYDSEDWQVIIPLTERASIKLGRNTRWCTAADSDNNQFNNYTHDGSKLIIIINTKGTKPRNKWQLHFEFGQWMDYQDDDVGNHSKFVDSLPLEVRLAIFNHTHKFIFNPNKKETVMEICSDNEKFVELKKKLSYKSFISAMRDTDTNNITDIIDDKLYSMAFYNLYSDAVINNNVESYSYGYAHPWLFLNEEPALRDEAENCDYCDGIGYMLWVRDDDEEWTTELDEEKYNQIKNNVKEKFPELLNEFISIYGKMRYNGTYMPMDDTALEMFCKKINNKCRFCSGTGKDYDEQDAKFWSEEQRMNAGQKSNDGDVSETMKDWEKEYDSDWSSDRDKRANDIYDYVIQNFLDMTSYPRETVNTIINLLDLFNLTDSKEDLI